MGVTVTFDATLFHINDIVIFQLNNSDIQNIEHGMCYYAKNDFSVKRQSVFEITESCLYLPGYDDYKPPYPKVFTTKFRSLTKVTEFIVGYVNAYKELNKKEPVVIDLMSVINVNEFEEVPETRLV